MNTPTPFQPKPFNPFPHRLDAEKIVQGERRKDLKNISTASDQIKPKPPLN